MRSDSRRPAVSRVPSGGPKTSSAVRCSPRSAQQLIDVASPRWTWHLRDEPIIEGLVGDRGYVALLDACVPEPYRPLDAGQYIADRAQDRVRISWCVTGEWT